LRLQELILGVFAVSIGTVLLPNLAEYAKTAQWTAFNERLISAIDIIALITIPITFFSFAQGEILIRLLFQNRSFDETSVVLTLSAFTFHMPGLFFIAFNRVLTPAFYAQSNSKSPTLAGLISFAVNITLAVLLVGPFRGAGIAFALTIASLVNTVALIVFLGKNPNIALGRTLGSLLINMLKLTIFSIIAVIPLHFLSPHLLQLFGGGNRIIAYGLPLFINGIVFVIIGIALMLVTRDKQFRYIVKRLAGRRDRGSGIRD
jgi:putative peptidoglycan lipid II flippase